MPPISVVALVGLLAAADGVAKAPRYYFRVVEVKAPPATEAAVKDSARDLLAKDLAARSEFTSDVGGATEPGQLLAELKRRRLDGFSLSLRIDEIRRELLPPKPGGRLKQLALNVKVSVFGTTLPTEKLAFSGEGEAGIEAEVAERRLDQEGATMLTEVLTQAIKQAVDQAVLKLSTPKSVPFNETRRKPKKK